MLPSSSTWSSAAMPRSRRAAGFGSVAVVAGRRVADADGVGQGGRDRPVGVVVGPEVARAGDPPGDLGGTGSACVSWTPQDWPRSAATPGRNGLPGDPYGWLKMWPSGADHREYTRRIGVLADVHEHYSTVFPEGKRYVHAGVERLPVRFVNARLVELGRTGGCPRALMAMNCLRSLATRGRHSRNSRSARTRSRGHGQGSRGYGRAAARPNPHRAQRPDGPHRPALRR